MEHNSFSYISCLVTCIRTLHLLLEKGFVYLVFIASHVSNRGGDARKVDSFASFEDINRQSSSGYEHCSSSLKNERTTDSLMNNSSRGKSTLRIMVMTWVIEVESRYLKAVYPLMSDSIATKTKHIFPWKKQRLERVPLVN